MIVQASGDIGTDASSSGVPLSVFFNNTPGQTSTCSRELSEIRSLNVKAHRKYLCFIFHEPIELDMKHPRAALQELEQLLMIGCAYGSEQILATPIEHLIRLHLKAFVPFFSDMAPSFVNIAIKLRSTWLFKDSICSLVGDQNWDDYTVGTCFAEYGVVPLILNKRIILRRMMRKIDQQSMVVAVTGTLDDCAMAMGSAAYTHYIVAHLHEASDNAWCEYAFKYRALQHCADVWDESHVVPVLKNMPIPSRKVGSAATSIFLKHHSAVIQLVKPLFETFLTQPVLHSDASSRLSADQKLFQGFTCIEILDKDIPWSISGN